MTEAKTAPDHRYGPKTAISVVIANMVGTGVFTSLGFQLADIRSGFVLMMLWVVGGLTALCGALSYAELGAALPRSGGEYNFLSETYHPLLGFVSGWVSATIGFAAPCALAAITFGTYLASVFPGLSPTWLASALIVAVTIIHARSRRASGVFQLSFTFLKVGLIACFCVVAWTFVREPQAVRFLPSAGDGSLLTSSAFAVSLIYVNYAYTGWNAATYLTGELANPTRNLSRVLIIGTSIVAVLYLMLNFTFLHVAPMDAMVGKVEIGYVAAGYVFGDVGAAIMGSALALLLISTVSAMVMAGPRVLQVIGQDLALFRPLARTNAGGVPYVAIYFQGAVTLLFVLTATFEGILVFAGFTLGVSTLFTVAGVFVLRARRPELDRPYRTPMYPLPPLAYLAVTGWTLIYILIERPTEGYWGLAILAGGALLYPLSKTLAKKFVKAE